MEQPIVWFHHDPAKSNSYCLYCGRFVGQGSLILSEREHWIARQLVPKGSFNNGKEFNFIFRACKECNNEKSNWERHISSISLLQSPDRH